MHIWKICKHCVDADVVVQFYPYLILNSIFLFLLFPMIVTVGSCSDPMVAGGNPRPSTLSAGLSLRPGGRGFSLATKRVTPGYFYWKIEEKSNQKKSLAV